MGRILVTPRSLTRETDPSLQLLEMTGYTVVRCTPGEMPSLEELKELLPACIGYLAGVEPITAEVLENAPLLKVISRNGTGIDNIDIEAADRLGIKVLRAEGANARGVAELTIAMLLCLSRHICYGHTAIQHALWKRKRGLEVQRRCLGLVGFGKVGQIVARLALALDMDVLAYDPFLSENSLSSDISVRIVSLPELLTGSDVISLHCPPAADGKPIISDIAVGQMRKGTLLINTARWDLIDEPVVLDALQSGVIGGLATDVFPSEPPELSELLTHENVITTPHIGGYTGESVSKAASRAVQNMLDYLDSLSHATP